MSPVRYELGFYIPEECVLHAHRRENLKSYVEITHFPSAIQLHKHQCLHSHYINLSQRDSSAVICSRYSHCWQQSTIVRQLFSL
jgi:hypothetical protein